jgi:predicted O-methyltransferase YrrM
VVPGLEASAAGPTSEQAILYGMRGREGAFIDGLKELLEEVPQGETAVEIGAYAGQSTELLCDSHKFERVITIDPYIDGYDPTDAPSTTHKLAEVRRLFYKRIFRHRQLLHLNLASGEAAGLFGEGSIAFLYIDGNHQYGAVSQDIDLFLPKMRRGGVISGHDYTLFEGVKKAVDERFGAPDRVFADTSWMVRL